MLMEQPRTAAQKIRSLEIDVFSLRDKVHSLEIALKLISDKISELADEATRKH